LGELRVVLEDSDESGSEGTHVVLLDLPAVVPALAVADGVEDLVEDRVGFVEGALAAQDVDDSRVLVT
jgi:hypothetical protein